MNYDPQHPFNDLPGLPPVQDIESKEILRKCISARVALASLREASALIPNQDVLINSIPLREAQASSEIENIITTTDKLFEHASLNNSQTDTATKETLRYRNALFDGYLNLQERPLSISTAITVCSTIKNVQMDIRTMSGTALRNDATGKIIYTPPEGQDRLRGKLADWESFIHTSSNVDPLICMAIAHYQFEAIHPFTDGNGRTGRILNILFLLQTDLLDTPILYLSHFLVRNKDAYYQRLLDVTATQNWEDWILFMLQAVEETSLWTTEKIKAIRRLIKYTDQYVREKAPAIHNRDLVDLIFVQPYCRISDLVEADIAERATASKYLKKLGDIGVLFPVKHGREKLFIHPKFLTLLGSDENNFDQYNG